MSATSELLKRLHESNSTAAASVEAVSAKKVKPPAKNAMSESDSSVSDDLLTGKANAGSKTDQTDQSQDGLLDDSAVARS